MLVVFTVSYAKTQRCKICGRKAYSEYCKLCEYALFQIDEIISLYLEGTTLVSLDDAIIEFDRIYYRGF